MCNFVEDYLHNPSEAIASAVRDAGCVAWIAKVDDELIYEQISSPEFRLYEEMIFFPVS